ncbi:MAG TPA: S8/S53 family peptidase, partial [Cytophagaceae bacterium]
YIDNFSGWDIANNDNDVRAKQATVQKTIKGSKGQDSIINVTLNGYGHASLVAGVSSASTNNFLGIAGTGFKCKFLPVKGMLDIDAEKGSVNYGYQGLIYAANHGCKIVNLSWGSTNSFSHAAQDAINYAVFNKDVLVIAAAGNQDVDQNYYPASYENVLSVAASSIKKSQTSDQIIDIKADFATYNYEVDLCAPGASIYTTYKSNNYTSSKGSSLAAPQVAGAAALVRSKYKDLSALQVGELLRVTADVMDTNIFNKAYVGKLGKGRLNMLKALTASKSPSVRMYHNNLSESVLQASSSADTLTLLADFVNFLHPTKDLTITLHSLSPNVVVIDSLSKMQIIKTLDSATNILDPFKVVILPNGKANEVITLRLSYNDSAYTDHQYFYIIVNPNYLTMDTNEISLTESGVGRLGLHDVFSKMTTGVGLQYKGNTLLYEGGLMISASGGRLSNCVRNEKGNAQDNNFVPLKDIRFVPSVTADQESFTEFQDTNKLNVPVSISQRSWAWKDAPSNKHILIEYSLKNLSSTKIDTIRAGIFADWDLDNSNSNRGNWDNSSSLGYTFTTDNSLYGGIAVISKLTPICYTIDNASTTAIGLYDGFTKTEKLTTLSQGTKNSQFITLKGSDLSQVVGAEIYSLQPSETRKICFSIQAGDNLSDLKTSVSDAQLKYAMINTVTQVENEFDNHEITVFPNPANDRLSLINLGDGATVIEILNVQGQILSTIKLHANEIDINISRLESGLYFVKIINHGASTLTKFVKN